MILLNNVVVQFFNVVIVTIPEKKQANKNLKMQFLKSKLIGIFSFNWRPEKQTATVGHTLQQHNQASHGKTFSMTTHTLSGS